MASVKVLLEGKDFKLTQARKALLDIFVNSTKPLSYEDIKSTLSMDKATFYRNITKFEEQKIINAIESHDKKRYFEIKAKSHAHFICTTCNSVECIKNGIYVTLKNYTISNVILQGICPTCNLANDKN
ncbi:MAG: transcriptional repressor [Sulfurospirillum sp.]|nr:transcriptional repressor [Sulfurospirillum sp.]